jgi:hypothetical protein
MQRLCASPVTALSLPRRIRLQPQCRPPPRDLNQRVKSLFFAALRLRVAPRSAMGQTEKTQYGYLSSALPSNSDNRSTQPALRYVPISELAPEGDAKEGGRREAADKGEYVRVAASASPRRARAQSAWQPCRPECRRSRRYRWSGQPLPAAPHKHRAACPELSRRRAARACRHAAYREGARNWLSQTNPTTAVGLSGRLSQRVQPMPPIGPA